LPRWGFPSTDGARGISARTVLRTLPPSPARSKEEIIRASAEIGVARIRDIFVALLERDPCPTPAETLESLVAELHARTDNPEYDMTRVALQTWAEALRDPVLHEHARANYRDALDHIVELATRWRDAGQIPADADTKAVAATIFTLMYGLIVMHHLVDDVSADTLLGGVSSLGAATEGSPLDRVARA
jgi:AcrR family transcriptional regulator